MLAAKGRIVYVNPAMEKILDVPRIDLLLREYQMPVLIRPDRKPLPVEESASIRAIKEQRLVEPTKIGMVEKDGQIVWTEMSAVPVALPG